MLNATRTLALISDPDGMSPALRAAVTTCRDAGFETCDRLKDAGVPSAYWGAAEEFGIQLAALPPAADARDLLDGCHLVFADDPLEVPAQWSAAHYLPKLIEEAGVHAEALAVLEGCLEGCAALEDVLDEGLFSLEAAEILAEFREALTLARVAAEMRGYQFAVTDADAVGWDPSGLPVDDEL